MHQLSDIQLTDLLGAPDEPTAQKRAASLAAALRQQQAQAQRQEFIGGLGSVFGAERSGAAKAYADMGRQQYAQAEGQLEQIPKVAEVRLQRALEKQRADQQAKYQDQEMALHEGDQKLKREQIEQGKFAPLAPGGQVYNTRTGELGAVGDVPRPTGRGGAAGALGAPKETDWTKFAQSLNSGGARSGELGANQKRINAAQRVQQLIMDPATGGVRNLDSREMGELATSLQSLLAQGGHSAEEVQHLIPHTFQGNLQGWLEKLTNEPRGVDQQAFVQKMAHTVEREMRAAQDSNKSMRLEMLPAYSPYRKANQARFDAILKGHGIDPASLDESLLPIQQQAAVTAASGGLSPEKQKRLEELRAKLKGGAPGAAK